MEVNVQTRKPLKRRSAPRIKRGKTSRKPAVKVPSSLDEAAKLELELADKLNEIDKQRARYTIAKAHLDADLEVTTSLLISQAVALAEQVHAYVDTNRKALTHNGHTKTITLANAGLVQWQTSPPAVRVTIESDVLERIRALGMSEFIRQPPPEIDREAMLATEECREKAAAIDGVSIEQAEKVYVRPAGSRGHVEATLGKKGPGKWKAVWPKDEASEK